MKKPILENLDPVIKIGEYSFDESVSYDLDENSSWVSNLLEELEEGLERPEGTQKNSKIFCYLTLKRKSGKPFGDHLLVRGELKASYETPCVRCLVPTPLTVNISFQCCFVPASLEKEPEFHELDEIFTENEEYDLYFYDKNKVDIYEMVHENLFMNIDHFPLHNKSCLGLCTECGHNLNEGPCVHSQTH